MRIHLTYFDQNEAFARALPEAGLFGTVVRRIALRDWGGDWCLLALEQPFEYNNQRHTQILIRSRWADHSVGGREKTSVFVLLLTDPRALDRETVESKDFEHVAWGMAETVRER